MVRSSRDGLVARRAVRMIAFVGVWAAAAYVEFGTPAFIVLLIVAMFSCGSGEKWSSDMSAYSVFNDGEQIAGTLSVEQIDGQMRNGGHAVRTKKETDSSFMRDAVRGWGGGTESVRGRKSASEPNDAVEQRRQRALAADAAQARAALKDT